jgi:multidrug resistance efflux pump
VRSRRLGGARQQLGCGERSYRIVLEARRDQAQQALADCAMRAPQSGTVSRLLAAPGDVLSTQSPRPALLFCPDAPRLVRAEVAQEFAGRVSLGQPVRIEDDVIGGATWQGKVLRIADSYRQRRPNPSEPAQLNDVRTLEVLVALESGPVAPRLGQRVRLRIGELER